MLAGIIGELLLSVDRILISIFFDDLQLGYYGLSANLFKGIRVIGIVIVNIMVIIIMITIRVVMKIVIQKMEEYQNTE